MRTWYDTLVNGRYIARAIFALAVAGFGLETIVCANVSANSAGYPYAVIPVIPWPPAAAWLAYLLGVVWLACAAGILFERTQRVAYAALAIALVFCALIFDAPRNAAHLSSISLRTRLLEPLAIAGIAWMAASLRGGRIIVALCLIVFGIDHFAVLTAVASLIPNWIPWHVFWTAFFGAAFIAAGLAVAARFWERLALGGMALMYAIWVVTLHVPRTLGAYGIPGATRDPNEWSSLLIAVALGSGCWLLAYRRRARARTEGA